MDEDDSVDGARYFWTKEADELLTKVVNEKAATWHEISEKIPGKNDRQCRLRWDRLRMIPLVRNGPWTEEEDELLLVLYEKYGRKWADIAREFQTRSAEQIRGRYIAALDPRVSKEKWTAEEHKTLLQAHYELGNHWTEIHQRLPGRLPKQIQYHYTGSVSVKTKLYLTSVGLENVNELTEDQMEDLLSLLDNRRGLCSLQKKLDLPEMYAVKPRSFANQLVTMGKPTYSVKRGQSHLSSSSSTGGSVVPAPSTVGGGSDGETAVQPAAKKAKTGATTSAPVAPAPVSTVSVSVPVPVPVKKGGKASKKQQKEAAVLASLNLSEDSSSEEEEGDVVHQVVTTGSNEGVGENGDGQEGEEQGALKAPRTVEDLNDTEIKAMKKLYKIWSPEEDAKLRELLEQKATFSHISEVIGTKTTRQCRVRSATHLNPAIKMGNWSTEEDQLLLNLVDKHGASNWYEVSRDFVHRTSEQLRGRYNNSFKRKGLHTPPTAEEIRQRNSNVTLKEKRRQTSEAAAGGDTSATAFDPVEGILPPEVLERNRAIAVHVSAGHGSGHRSTHAVDENARRASRGADKGTSGDEPRNVWTVEEDILLQQLADQGFTFQQIEDQLTNKSEPEARKRLNYLRRHGNSLKGKKYVRSGAWSEEEETQLLQAIDTHGESWAKVSKEMGGTRTPRQVADRYRKMTGGASGGAASKNGGGTGGGGGDSVGGDGEVDGDGLVDGVPHQLLSLSERGINEEDIAGNDGSDSDDDEQEEV